MLCTSLVDVGHDNSNQKNLSVSSLRGCFKKTCNLITKENEKNILLNICACPYEIELFSVLITILCRCLVPWASSVNIYVKMFVA